MLKFLRCISTVCAAFLEFGDANLMVCSHNAKGESFDKFSVLLRCPSALCEFDGARLVLRKIVLDIPACRGCGRA